MKKNYEIKIDVEIFLKHNIFVYKTCVFTKNLETFEYYFFGEDYLAYKIFRDLIFIEFYESDPELFKDDNRESNLQWSKYYFNLLVKQNRLDELII